MKTDGVPSLPAQPAAKALVAPAVDKIQSAMPARPSIPEQYAPKVELSDTGLTQKLSTVSDGGRLLGEVIRNLPPRDGVRLVLVATQLGLLGASGLAQSQKNLEKIARRHPLFEALGMSAPDAQELTQRTALLADQLRNAVQRSGLFYESHLKLWREGKWTLKALQDEPQTDWEPLSVLMSGLSQDFSEEQQRAALLANQQLNLLVNPKLCFLLPGLNGEPVELNLWAQEERGEGAPGEADLEKQFTWHFGLSVQLPTIGRVHLDYSMKPNGNTLDVTVEPGLMGSALSLEDLARRLGGASIQVKSFKTEKG